MGNQPSAPTPPATPVQNPVPSPPPPPPLPPPCDLECQKQNQLTLLKQNMDAIDPTQDPEGYEQARISYFTLLNGPGWLAQEKNNIASQEVEPVLKSYQDQYNALKGEQQSQKIFTNLATALKSQEAGDEESNRFLNKQLNKEKTDAEVKDRLNQLTAGTPYTPPQTSQYISWAIDILIAILGIFVIYKLYNRFAGQIIMSPNVPVLTSS